MSNEIPKPVAKILPQLVTEREFIDRTYEALGRFGLANNSALAPRHDLRDLGGRIWDLLGITR